MRCLLCQAGACSCVFHNSINQVSIRIIYQIILFTKCNSIAIIYYHWFKMHQENAFIAMTECICFYNILLLLGWLLIACSLWNSDMIQLSTRDSIVLDLSGLQLEKQNKKKEDNPNCTNEDNEFFTISCTRPTNAKTPNFAIILVTNDENEKEPWRYYVDSTCWHHRLSAFSLLYHSLNLKAKSTIQININVLIGSNHIFFMCKKPLF